MPLPKEKQYTTAYIESLPEGQRAELIDGVVYDLAAPMRIHQEVLHYLDRVIGNHIAEHRPGCRVYPAPFAVYLSDDGYNYVEPDLSVICDPGKLTDRGCQGAPEWVIEIVSPSSQRMDYLVKLFKYRAAGVQLYWIVNPDSRTVTVYDFGHDSSAQYTFADAVPVALCEGFSICLQDAVDAAN